MTDLDAPTVPAVMKRWERLYNTLKEMDAKGEKFENAGAVTPKTKATPKKRKVDNDNADTEAVPSTPTKKSRGRPKKVNALTVEQVEAAAKEKNIAATGAEEDGVAEIATEEIEE